MMDWTILIVLAGLWLVSPVVLLIALVVSRHQLAEARQQAAQWERLARSRDESSETRQEAPIWESTWPSHLPAPKPSPPSPATLTPLTLTLSPLAGGEGSEPLSFAKVPSPQAAEGWEARLDADWRPAEPGPLEHALRVMSGWPKLIAPFLAQNIGWFVGGFCFVAGALFLVANTAGFANALVVWGSLVSATAFLIWAGYQFRRKRPELVAVSGVLLTLGLLLGSLDLAVAVRLFDASGSQILLLAMSSLLATVTLAAFAWTARLTSALVDRALSGRYAGLLTALAGLQLAAPLANLWPDWQALAALHLIMLILLGVGLRRFTGEWLRQIFVDQRRTGYFAAGMLVYASAVSFVHLIWIWPTSLPVGYAGPFLMALCLLLFPVDAALKEWIHQYAALSRFSFALYGLSIIAVVMAVPNTPTALLTLMLGAGLYGWMTWRYLTLPPLYLLFGCVAGLYGYGVLQWLPPAGHLLASAPGLLTLLALSRWAVPRSPAIARQCLLTFGMLLLGLTSWSLFWSVPGIVGFATAVTAAILGYGAMRWIVALPDADPRWSIWAESWVVALAAVAVAYAPGWTPLGWAMQTAFGWLALAAVWSGLGLHDRRRETVWVTGALAMMVGALALAGSSQWPLWFGQWELIALLGLAGALLLWLSLGLRRQSLFYGVLVVAAALGVLVKQGYFPGPGLGLAEFSGVMALWAFLWWVEPPRRFAPPLLIQGGESIAEVVRVPLEQAMALLWTVGLVRLGARLLEGNPSLMWPWSAGLAVMSGVLLIGYFHQFRWVALPMLLGLAGLLVELVHWGWPLPWLGAAAGLYALLVWRLGVMALELPLTGLLARALRFTVPGGSGGRRQVEDSLHGCALLIAVCPVAVSPTLDLLGQPAPVLWPMLGTSLLVFVLTGWRYRTEIHAWLMLVTLTLGIWLTGFWLQPDSGFIFNPVVNAVWSLSMAFAAAVLEAERAAMLAWWRRPLWMIGGLLYGLALVGVWFTIDGLSPAVALTGLALYLVLLLRHSARPGIAGLALAALIASSLLIVADHLNLPLVWLPLTLVLWHGALLAIWRYYGSRSPNVWQPALVWWLTLLPAASVGLLFLMPDADGAMWSLTLLTLAVTTGLFGDWQDAMFWRKAGLWLALAGGYTLWQWNAPLTWEASMALAPWYALQSGLSLLAFTFIKQRLTRWLDAQDVPTHGEHSQRGMALEQAMRETTPWLWLATLVFIGLHIGAVLAALVGWNDWPLWYFGMTLDALAASATLALLTGWTAVQAWRRPQEPHRIYVVMLLMGVLAGYARLAMWGPLPLTPWDTTGFMATAFAMFLLHQFTGASPWYRLAVLFPLLALATAPWQLASPWLGGTLLTAGVLYLSLAGTMRNPLPLYLGVLALNGAVYLWAPLWAGRYGLWQFYLIPGAASVLVLLHLHRRELRPSVLNGGRLAALSVLYAGAGLDVFLRPELWVFVLALGLALAGIVVGIALRIRAFLYAGVAFLVLNVAGQLLQFYPEQGFGRALILIGLGATITGGMVLFNLKREAILQRIRMMRADLAAWE